jgi:hypothetical protein
MNLWVIAGTAVLAVVLMYIYIRAAVQKIEGQYKLQSIKNKQPATGGND